MIIIQSKSCSAEIGGKWRETDRRQELFKAQSTRVKQRRKRSEKLQKYQNFGAKEELFRCDSQQMHSHTWEVVIGQYGRVVSIKQND